MRSRDVPVIVRPSDLRMQPVPREVAQAIRSGRFRMVGPSSEGDPRRLLELREATRRGWCPRPR